MSEKIYTYLLSSGATAGQKRRGKMDRDRKFLSKEPHEQRYKKKRKKPYKVYKVK